MSNNSLPPTLHTQGLIIPLVLGERRQLFTVCLVTLNCLHNSFTSTSFCPVAAASGGRDNCFFTSADTIFLMRLSSSSRLILLIVSILCIGCITKVGLPAKATLYHKSHLKKTMSLKGGVRFLFPVPYRNLSNTFIKGGTWQCLPVIHQCYWLCRLRWN